jgi:hypothetical protein
MKTYILAHDNSADFSDVVVGQIKARSAQQALYGFWLSCEFSFLGISRCTDIPDPESPFSEDVQKVQLWDRAAGKYINAWIEEKE